MKSDRQDLQQQWQVRDPQSRIVAGMAYAVLLAAACSGAYMYCTSSGAASQPQQLSER